MIRLVRSMLLGGMLLWAVSPLASAAPTGDPLFGAEFEFTNPKVAGAYYGDQGNQHASDENIAARDAWAKKMKALCKKRGDCKVTEIEDWFTWDHTWTHDVASYKVTYKDGFWFQISLDPAVVEIQVAPVTAQRAKELQSRVQADIFDVAKSIQLEPRSGLNHLHIGAESAFDLELNRVRDFSVDFMNHQELAMLFGEDLYNAPPLAVLPAKQQAEFATLIRDVDSGKVKTIEDFTTRMRKTVYSRPYSTRFLSEDDPVSKFHALNVERMRKKLKNDAKTVEIRTMPAQRSAQDFVDLTDLVDRRIRFLRQSDERIALLKFNPKAAKELLVSNFRRYVEESGADWKTYQRFLAPAYRKAKATELPPTARGDCKLGVVRGLLAAD